MSLDQRHGAIEVDLTRTGRPGPAASPGHRLARPPGNAASIPPGAITSDAQPSFSGIPERMPVPARLEHDVSPGLAITSSSFWKTPSRPSRTMLYLIESADSGGLMALVEQILPPRMLAVPHYVAPCCYTIDPASGLVTSHFQKAVPEFPAEWITMEYAEDHVMQLMTWRARRAGSRRCTRPPAATQAQSSLAGQHDPRR